MTFAKALTCDSNPYDIRPALDLITAWAQHLVSSDDRPLYLLFGEHHNRPFDIILRQAVLERLIDEKKNRSGPAASAAPAAPIVAYGAESDSTMLEWLIENWYGIDIPDGARGKINSSDTYGDKFLRAVVAAYVPTLSPYSRRNLWASLLATNTPFQCNDTPRTDDDASIDYSDAHIDTFVRRLIGAGTGDIGTIDLASLNGMMIRNHFIAERAIAHQRSTGARIYIQDCGKHHLFGYHKEGLSYRGSLSQIFTEKGQKILAIANLARHFKLAHLPRDGARSAFRRSGVALSDFAADTFHGVFDEEIEVIERMHRASGREFSLFDFSIPDDDDTHFRQVESEIPKWIDGVCPNHSPTPE